MLPLRSGLIFAAVAAVFVTFPPLSAGAAPTPEDKEEARILVIEARTALEVGRIEEALKALRRADELDPIPQTKLDLAQALLSGSKLIEASKVLNGVINATPATPKKALASAKKMLEALEPRIPWIQIQVVGPPQNLTSTTIDGKEIDAESEIPYDPGEHKIAADADGYEPIEKKIKLTEGAHEVVRLEMKRIGGPRVAKTPGGSEASGATSTDSDKGGATSIKKSGGGSLTDNPLFIPAAIAAGVGVVSVGVGTAFGVMALNGTADLKRSCDGNTCPDTSKFRRSQDAVLVDGNVATAMFIVGGVGIAAGGVLMALVLTSDPPKGKEKAFVRPWIGVGQAGLYGAF